MATIHPQQYITRKSFIGTSSLPTCLWGKMAMLKLPTLGSVTSLRERMPSWPAQLGRQRFSPQRPSQRPARISLERLKALFSKLVANILSDFVKIDLIKLPSCFYRLWMCGQWQSPYTVSSLEWYALFVYHEIYTVNSSNSAELFKKSV